MHIERYGAGPHRFLGIHGWNGAHRTFLPLVDSLPPNISFHAADLPGCGQSPAPARWDLAGIADEIASHLEGPTTLVGNCSGAILALITATRAPSLVNRIVMVDAFAWWPWYFRIFLAPHIGRPAYLTTFANPIGRWLTNASLRNKRAASTDLTAGFASTNHDNTYRYLTLFGNAGGPQQFAALNMPIDILYGARSFSAVRASAQTWANLWPHARLFELDAAGHLPIIEATSQVKNILYEGDS